MDAPTEFQQQETPPKAVDVVAESSSHGTPALSPSPHGGPPTHNDKEKAKKEGESTESEPVKVIPRTFTTANASRCVLLKNCFNPTLEEGQSWVRQMEFDFRRECKNYGFVTAIHVDPDSSDGDVYIKFEHTHDAIKATADLNRCSFGGRIISASTIPEDIYDVMFPLDRLDTDLSTSNVGEEKSSGLTEALLYEMKMSLKSIDVNHPKIDHLDSLVLGINDVDASLRVIDHRMKQQIQTLDKLIHALNQSSLPNASVSITRFIEMAGEIRNTAKHIDETVHLIYQEIIESEDESGDDSGTDDGARKHLAGGKDVAIGGPLWYGKWGKSLFVSAWWGGVTALLVIVNWKGAEYRGGKKEETARLANWLHGAAIVGCLWGVLGKLVGAVTDDFAIFLIVYLVEMVQVVVELAFELGGGGEVALS